MTSDRRADLDRPARRRAREILALPPADLEVLVMTTGPADHPAAGPSAPLDGPELVQHRQPRSSPRELLDNLLSSKNVQPIRSVDDLACEGIFDTEDEVDEFITFTYAQRQTGTA
ncbi:hypothetical protein [Amycolatopsis nigrescens]|uniref:hypothetical protein n=1 Tax=Amycolatopsis nigrescens TaxID=381445 RepID=UPI0003659B92|nr:hypothetical protein [Amycolatopsis nigrescens]